MQDCIRAARALVAIVGIALPAAALADGYRSIDGSGNAVGDLGSAGDTLLRMAPSDYGDGVSTPAGAGRPSPREISNAVSDQSGSMPDPGGLSGYFWLFGQFLDHDIDLTETQSGPDAERFDIPVPAGDPDFAPATSIPLTRSVFDPATGTGAGNPREQTNAITSFIDASNVYGSDTTRAAALRDGSSPYLKTSDGDMLPFNTGGLPNANEGPTPDAQLYLAGDVRANENVALTAMHTIWVREHNAVAAEIAADHPELDDEEVFQRARQQVGAMLQAITYEEFLPILLGPNALDPYTELQADVDPRIANVFSAAAYRFGHSLLPGELLRLDASAAAIAEGPLPLTGAFFAPGELGPGDLEPFLRGLSWQPSQTLDPRLVDEVRNLLFGPPGAGGLDLASLNIQRGRDHGLPDYNSARQVYGLDPVGDFDEITSDAALAAALELLYGDVDDIDLWVGGLAEDALMDALVGELFHAIFSDQFQRLRDGDAHYYEAIFAGEELEALRATRLADVILRNSDLDWMPGNAFFTVPEPATGLLALLGLAALAKGRGRRLS